MHAHSDEAHHGHDHDKYHHYPDHLDDHSERCRCFLEYIENIFSFFHTGDVAIRSSLVHLSVIEQGLYQLTAFLMISCNLEDNRGPDGFFLDRSYCQTWTTSLKRSPPRKIIDNTGNVVRSGRFVQMIKEAGIALYE